MNIRDDIAELLRAGTPQIHICRQLRVAPLTVQRTREALGLPARKTCRVLPTTLEEAFRQYTRPTNDGHETWTGPDNNGAAKLTFEGTVYYARRLAFRFHHGREPVGAVTAACTVKGCVAGRCVEDLPMRRKAHALYAAVFGGVS
jgi:hypothetical protein